MTDVTDDFLKVKKSVKSLLTVTKDGIVLSKFEDQYNVDAYSGQFPYRKLGYATAYDLLKAMPDVVQVVNNRVSLVPAANSTSGHIRKLVFEQDGGNRQHRRPSRFRSTYDSHSNRAMSFTGPRVEVKTKPKFVPNRDQNDISYFMQKHTSGVALVDFEGCFRQFIGRPLNYKAIGFSRLEQMLESIPDIVVMRTNGKGTRFVHPVPGLIKSPKDTKLTNPVCTAKSRLGGQSDGMDFPTGSNQWSQRTEQLQSHQKTMAALDGFDEWLEEDELIPWDNAVSSTPKQKIDTIAESGSPSSNVMQKNLAIPTDMLATIKQLVLKYPGGIEVEMIDHLYKLSTGKSLDLLSMGFSNIVEFVESLPEIVVFHRNKKGFNLAMPSSKLAISRMEPIAVSLDIQNRTVAVLKKAGQEITIVKFTEIYEEMFPTFKRDLVNHNQRSLLDFLRSMSPDIVTLHYMTRDKDVISLSESFESQNPILVQQCNTSFMKLPNAYKQVNISEGNSGDDWIEVQVAEVYSPHLFWVMLYGNNWSRSLDIVMDQMQTFYSQSRTIRSHRLSHEDTILYQLVVCLYLEDDNFYRAKITGFRGLTEVEVFFVDYGTVYHVPRNQIFYLDSQFADFPAQAIQAKLSHVKKKGGQWVHGTSKYFLQLVSNKPLVTQVQETTQDGIVGLILVDTNGSTDIIIHERLVSLGYVDSAAPTIDPSTEISGAVGTAPDLIQRTEQWVLQSSEYCTGHSNENLQENVDQNRMSAAASSQDVFSLEDLMHINNANHNAAIATAIPRGISTPVVATGVASCLVNGTPYTPGATNSSRITAPDFPVVLDQLIESLIQQKQDLLMRIATQDEREAESVQNSKELTKVMERIKTLKELRSDPD